MVRRVYVEKKDGFDVEARRLKTELSDFLGGKFPELAEIKNLRILRRYDADHLNEEEFNRVTALVFSEPWCDNIFPGAEPPIRENDRFFGIEYTPGQYDQRSDSAEQCAELVIGVKPIIKTASIFIFEGSAKPISPRTLEGIKKFLINPVNSRETSNSLPLSLEEVQSDPDDVPILAGFIELNEGALKKLAEKYGITMSEEDLVLCRDWFSREHRDPTLTEIKVLDVYWSDHCRHSTFNTALEEIGISGEDIAEKTSINKALELYEKTRLEVYGDNAANPKRSLMDMATIGAKALKKRGLLPDLDESPEVNACTIKVKAEFSIGSPSGISGGDSNANSNYNTTVASEPWLLLFKNETHNHPTEIEPFGGAATCLGGGIRDPLSGRAIVHQAMRITGGGDPRAGFNETIPGKLPQIKIAHEAASGYSSYGNQIGLAAGQVTEFYHPGFLAKRMELGALIGAVPEDWVCREEPVPGDVVILVGGKTGRDGIGGATSSSKIHSEESAENARAEVQKGNAVEERKILRLFQKAGISRLIKRCNDFGAGGVSVAVGELAPGLDINLDAVPVKYPGLDGTELAISESQERMAVVTSAGDSETFIKAASDENLEAVIIAQVTKGNQVSAADDVPEDVNNYRLRMSWRGKTIVDISRELLNSNGAPRKAKALIKAGGIKEVTIQPADNASALSAGVLLDNLERELASLRSGSRRGVQEQFGGSAGAGTVLFPWGGSEQGTPECGMAALLPVADRSSPCKQSRTASLMTFGYDPVLMSLNPYRGAKGSVLEALTKFACLGGDPFKARLSFQEYFERTNDPETWGLPAAALLGALEAQLCLGVPAIGGKDSMSGNYRDENQGINLTVPPTLIAFAAGTAAVKKVRSGALSGKGGNAVILLSQSGNSAVHKDEWELFKANMKILENLAASGALKAAYPVGPGGIAAALAIMAFGNKAGVEAYADSFSEVNPLNYQGSVLAEIDEAALPAGFTDNLTLAARTLDEPMFRIVQPAVPGDDENPEALAAETPLEVLRRAYEYPLSRVYPQTSTGETIAEIPDKADSLKLPAIKVTGTSAEYAQRFIHINTHNKPVVVIPVFPGTNCEPEMEGAFRKAGSGIRLVIFKNRQRTECSPIDIEDSLKELAAAIREGQIIALPGGSSAGDEPGGSAKFIVNVLRSPRITAAITEFLEKQNGLILGIGNGFQALIKTGLVPYGRIVPLSDDMPAITFNRIGRHVSRMIRTRVMPSISPWLGLEEEGSIHVIPVSHSEGRIVIRHNEAETLFATGQVPFCYTDKDGNPTMAEPDNPNGSAFAIEAITSPDGRILGKMAHSEWRGEYVHINIPGNKNQRIFEAGVNYFKY